jgi:hypothetical protein
MLPSRLNILIANSSKSYKVSRYYCATSATGETDVIVTFPQTLAHIENFPLLTMSGEELLLNQKRFETNLKKAGMHLASLVGHNPERYELASTYFELEE